MFSRIKRGCQSATGGLLPGGRWLLLLLGVFLVGNLKLSAQGYGFGSYDLRSPEDLAVSFDYNGTGLADHILLYRPGTGIVYIMGDTGGVITTAFSSGTGIGGYDLKSPLDRIIPFDYNGTGIADHLILYRPGSGILWILENTAGVFTPVYQSGFGGSTGIGGYDLASTSDRLIAFDYDGSGVNDHLLFYRPGSGTVFILENTSGTFAPVFTSATGIGTWPLTGASDILAPFDYYSIGSTDHLIAYTPGTGKVSIIGNQNGVFGPVYESTTGIGGYDLMSTSDRLIAYDFNGTGSKDHIIAYRPGAGIFWVIQSSYLAFSPVVNDGTNGVGGFDLMSPKDHIVVMNYSGTPGSLFIYRSGEGIAYIETHNSTTYTDVYASTYNPTYVPGLNRPAREKNY